MAPRISLFGILLVQILGFQLLVSPDFFLAGAVVRGGYWLQDLPLVNINFNYETHVYYAFAGLDPSSYQVVAPTTDNGQYATFVATAKSSNPSVVTLLSIGGGAANFTTFGEMVSTSTRRQAFIDSSISLARQYSYEGLDLDWESPQSQTEIENLALLLQEWRAAAHTEAQSSGNTELLLTAAVSYQSILLYTGVGNQVWPITAFNTYLDWVNVMTYDYHGSWEPTTTGEHTALYDPNSDVDTDYGINNWLSAGMQADKMCLGLAFYGKQWVLASLANTGVGAPATSGGDPITYADIVTYNNAGGATVEQDSTTVSMYSYKSDLTWIGYDNPDTIAAKVQYAQSKSLLGYFAWALHQDDANFSLASAAQNAWT